ncbi:HU family DNA-binding protein [Silvanigrella paludirubra]|jgi:DNA-binding protein HU-beta|uniref:HU family DNA-binding protein n=2 Tax=Silvanigrellaceae TaxID=2024974 RepID=A0A6N6VQ01_9BACT|nr:HU family DNA-binding protein [Silvanigrella paludirubra]
MFMTKRKVATVSTSALTVEVSSRFDQLPKKLTKEVIAAFLDAIEDHVAAGKKVRIDKLGILQVKDRAARKGRNPQTGEEIKIPASKKVSFRVASSLKEKVGVKRKSAAKKKK